MVNSGYTGSMLTTAAIYRTAATRIKPSHIVGTMAPPKSFVVASECQHFRANFLPLSFSLTRAWLGYIDSRYLLSFLMDRIGIIAVEILVIVAEMTPSTCVARA